MLFPSPAAICNKEGKVFIAMDLLGFAPKAHRKIMQALFSFSKNADLSVFMQVILTVN